MASVCVSLASVSADPTWQMMHGVVGKWSRPCSPGDSRLLVVVMATGLVMIAPPAFLHLSGDYGLITQT